MRATLALAGVAIAVGAAAAAPHALLRQMPSGLAFPEERSCTPAGTKCAGDEGYQLVPYAPCCDAAQVCGYPISLPAGQWGRFCLAAAAVTADKAETNVVQPTLEPEVASNGTDAGVAPVSTVQSVDGDGNSVTTVANADGSTTVITTDADGTTISTASSVTDDDGNTVTTTVDADNNTTVVTTDSTGAVVTPIGSATATTVAPSDSTTGSDVDSSAELTAESSNEPTVDSSGEPTVDSSGEPTAEASGDDIDDRAGEASDDGDSVCFPADAHVELAGGSFVPMHALAVGDNVRVGVTEFSRVFMFTHKLTDASFRFVALSTASGASLSLTPGHYLYVNGALAAARSVVVGDQLTLATGALDVVVAVGTRAARGLFNPQTVSGNLVVDGVLASTYTTAVEPAFAHAVLAPLRALSEVFGLSLTALESGGGALAGFAPRGQPVM